MRRGARDGADRTEEMLDWAHELGIRHITLYTFSTENFSRTKEEMDHLFSLFREKFTSVVTDERVKGYRIRVQMVGNRSMLPDDLRSAIDAAEEATRDHDGFYLNIALAYGGRNEIVLAARQILKEVAEMQIALRQSMSRWSSATSMVENGYHLSTLLSGRGTNTAPRISCPGLQTAMNRQCISVPRTGRCSGRSIFSGPSVSMTSASRKNPAEYAAGLPAR